MEKSNRKYYVFYVSVGLNFEPCQLLAIELKQTYIFLVSLICVRNLHAGSMVPGLACFAFFLTHDHESVKRESVSREMYTFLEPFSK